MICKKKSQIAKTIAIERNSEKKMKNKIPGGTVIITSHQTMSNIPIEIYTKLIYHNIIRQICKLFRDSDYINKRFITKNISKYRPGDTFKNEPFGAYAFEVREKCMCVRYVAFGPTTGEYYSGELDGCNCSQRDTVAGRGTHIAKEYLHMLHDFDNQKKNRTTY